MRIRRIELRDFGCLSGHIEFQPEGLNLWIAPNEEGKSTLAASILEGLYGPRKPKPTDPLWSWQPLNDGAFSLALELELQGKRVIIERNFRHGRVRIWEDGHDITDRFLASKNKMIPIGEELLDLSREEFQKSVFVEQGKMAIQDPEGLTRVLQRVADAQGGERTVAEALDALEQIENDYPLRKMGKKLKLSTEKKRLKQRIAELTAEIQKLEQRRNRIEDKEDQLSRLHVELNERRCQQTTTTYLLYQTELQEVENQLQQDSQRRERIRQLEEEQERLADYAEFPDAQQRNLYRWLDEIDRLSTEITQLKRKLEEERRRLEACEQSLEQLRELAHCTQHERDDLLGLIKRLEEAERSDRELCNRMDKERARLAAEGFDEHRLEELQELFERLSPEDRRFLYEASHARAQGAQQRENIALRRDRAEESLQEIESKRAHWRRITRLAGLSGLVALGAGLALTAWGNVTAGGILTGIGALMALGGAVLHQRGKSKYDRDYENIKLDLQRAQEDLNRLEQDEQERDRRLRFLARELETGSEEDLLTSFAEWQALQQETVELQRLLAQWEGVQDELRQLREEAYRWCEHRGVALQLDKVSSASLGEILENANLALSLRSRQEELRRKISEREGDIIQKEKQLQMQNQAVEELLQESGLDSSLRGEDARTAFDQAVKKVQRFRQLVQEIERERELLLPPEERNRLKERIEELKQQIAQMQSDWPEGTVCPDPDADRIFYQRQLDQITNDIEEMREKVSCLEEEIRSTLQETRSLPELYQELRDRKQSLKRAEKVESAVAIAKDTLRHISTEVYEIWAEHLNGFATRAFQEILPHYGKPRFEKDLRLTFIHPETKQKLHASQDRSPPRLSGGTVEQLYFIVRAAIADFLAQGKLTLPLVLDEPFPHSHDERFLKGMKLLAEHLARDRQVIVFSCHEVRHRWLFEQVPRLKERIHQVRFCKQRND